MKLTGPQVIGELRTQLPVGIGRHLYAVLGTYARLAHFETNHLAEARTADGAPFPTPINLNRALLDSIPDDELRKLVRDEARRPQAVQHQLNDRLRELLQAHLAATPFLILKQMELLFAFDLELAVFRTLATDQSHILLLLPGERRGEHIILFHEADARFQRTLPGNLVAENHLWELME